MKVFYFESLMGCGLREYRTLNSAFRGILREVGEANGVSVCREATIEDIDNVRAMCGYVPDRLLSQLEKRV